MLIISRYGFNPRILVDYFDLKVREMCKSCKRYGTKATCPPYIKDIEYYKNLLPLYREGTLVVREFKVTDKSKWVELGKQSSLDLHKYLLTERKELLKNNQYFINIFGAGSCKNCEECSFPCKFPDKSIIPIEATGINVVKLAKDIARIDVKFPITNRFYRIGLVLYG